METSERKERWFVVSESELGALHNLALTWEDHHPKLLIQANEMCRARPVERVDYTTWQSKGVDGDE